MLKTKRILTVTLNPALDVFCRVSSDSTGKNFVVNELMASAGGKGINVSRVLHRLGVNTLALGCVGGTTGTLMKKMIEKEKIPYSFVVGGSKTRTNVTMICPARNTSAHIISKGNPVSLKDIQKFKKIFFQNLLSRSMVVLSGRLPPGVKDSFYFELIELAKQRHIPSVLDSHGQAFKIGLKAKPFCIKPNREEAEFIVREKLNSLSKIKHALKYFLDSGTKMIILSLGEEGAVATEGRGVWLALPPKIKGGHDVGCGDALIAGFIFSIQKKLSFPRALQMAVATGTANALAVKPGEIQRKEIHRLLAEVKIKAI